VRALKLLGNTLMLVAFVCGGMVRVRSSQGLDTGVLVAVCCMTGLAGVSLVLLARRVTRVRSGER